MHYGLEGAVDLWRPVGETPAGKEGAEWKSSGFAWLFEAGPSVRFMTGQPDDLRNRLFGQVSGGVVFVASDAEIISYPVAPNPIGTPVEIMESQAAPYMEIGIGALSRKAPIGTEFAIKAHTLFVTPESTTFVSIAFGLNF